MCVYLSLTLILEGTQHRLQFCFGVTSSNATPNQLSVCLHETHLTPPSTYQWCGNADDGEIDNKIRHTQAQHNLHAIHAVRRDLSSGAPIRREVFGAFKQGREKEGHTPQTDKNDECDKQDVCEALPVHHKYPHIEEKEAGFDQT